MNPDTTAAVGGGRSPKAVHSFRLDPTSERLLTALAVASGLSRGAVVSLAVRGLARSSGLLDTSVATRLLALEPSLVAKLASEAGIETAQAEQLLSAAADACSQEEP